MSNTYVNLTASRGFILSLFKLTHIPVKIFNYLTSQSLYDDWKIEKNPPFWLPEEVIKFKNQLTWKDRAYFWHLLLRSGTKAAQEDLGGRFLPQLIARSLFIIFKSIITLFFKPIKNSQRFKKHPIKAYLEFTGSFSGATINWIWGSKYGKNFIKTARRAGFPIGFYYGKQYLENPIFSTKISDSLRAMQFIMVVYVLFGLAGWEKHIYPRNQPIITIKKDKEVSISFKGLPYKCPHRNMRCPKICSCFVSWEDGLVQAVDPSLKSYVRKTLAAGNNECEVVIEIKKDG
jgi:hypothetical protein